MDADGGLSKFTSNKAGAKYGTGYCDSQCPQDIKFINGEANVEGWGGEDANTGIGKFGTCCAEMDLWEANLDATAYTPHPCSVAGQTKCEGADCGSGDDRYAGVCDKDGCDFNSMRMGVDSFYGTGKTVDTSKPLTVVTQFITEGGKDNGVLQQIKRFYVQNGKVIPNSNGKDLLSSRL
jgi:cellulose 1,4-beta-cellobiosidase